MHHYYTKSGKVVGTAWSYMHCGSEENHKPHIHNPEHALYSPYMCGGFPIRKLYTTPKRKPAN